jgi:fructokinase
MQARWGVSPENLPADHPAWKLEAQYLAQAFANIVLTVAPDKIVVGGGIGLHKGLVEIVDEQVRALLGGYIRAFDAHRAEGLSDETEHRIVRAALGAEAGILGAAYLGWEAASSSDFV